MPDDVPPVEKTGPLETPAAGSPKAEPPKDTGNPSKEAELEKRLNGMSATINRLEKELAKKGDSVVATEPPKEGDLTGRIKVVEEQTRKLAEKEQKLHRNAVLQTISAKLTAAGHDAETASRFATLIQGELKGIEVKEGDDLSLTPVIKDGEATVNLGSYLDSYFQTDKGRVLLPHKSNPKMPSGGAPVNGAKPKLTKADMQKGNFEMAVLKKGGYEIVD